MSDQPDSERGIWIIIGAGLIAFGSAILIFFGFRTKPAPARAPSASPPPAPEQPRRIPEAARKPIGFVAHQQQATTPDEAAKEADK